MKRVVHITDTREGPLNHSETLTELLILRHLHLDIFKVPIYFRCVDTVKENPYDRPSEVHFQGYSFLYGSSGPPISRSDKFRIVGYTHFFGNSTVDGLPYRLDGLVETLRMDPKNDGLCFGKKPLKRK